MGDVMSVTVGIDGEDFEMDFKPKRFRTGSRGYYVWGKVRDSEGKRYQVIMNLVEIGSKNSP